MGFWGFGEHRVTESWQCRGTGGHRAALDTPGPGPCRLLLRPLLSGRDYHALHHENPAFDFTRAVADGAVTWRPYPGLPADHRAGRLQPTSTSPSGIAASSTPRSSARGLDCVEDLASPGVLEWDLAAGQALLLLRAGRARAEPGALIEAERRAGRGKRRSTAPPTSTWSGAAPG